MHCEKVRGLLAAFTADALRHGLKLRIEEHLETCPACQREHQALLKTMSLVESLTPVEPVRDIWGGVYSRIRRPAPTWSLRPALMKAAVGAGIAGAVAFAAGRAMNPGEPAAVMAKTAGPMAPYIQQHMALVIHDALADPASAGLIESVSDR